MSAAVPRKAPAWGSAWWPLWVALCVLLGVALRVPAFQGERLLDDYTHLAEFEGAWGRWKPWDLYVVGRGEPGRAQWLKDHGIAPWWVPDDARAGHLRSLSSLTLWLDYTLLGSGLLGLRLSSLVWWCALLLGTAALFKRVLSEQAAALALLLYALAKAHTMPLAWVANRCAWIAVAFSVWSLWAYVRLRQDDWRPGRWLAPLLFAAALLGGEYAIGAFPFFALYEVLCTRDALSRRVRALGGVALVLFAYAVAYEGLGYGTTGAAGYVGPLEAPWRFAGRAAALLPLLLIDGVAGVRAAPGPAALPVAAACLFGAVLLLTLALEGTARRRALWLLVAGLAAMPSLVAAPYGPRLNVLASIGVLAGLSAGIVAALGHLCRPTCWLRVAVTVPLALVALLGHLVAAPAEAHAETHIYRAMAQAQIDDAARVPLDADRPVVLLTSTTSWAPGLVSLVRRVYGGVAPPLWYPLSPTDAPHRLTRTAEREFELQSLGDIHSAPRVVAARVSERLPVGPQRIGPLTLTVNEGLGTRLRVVLDDDIAGYQFLAVYPAGLREVRIPDVGGSISLPSPIPPH